ncbi:MAG: DUF1223 domain-containing protein [Paracoccus sp. (in: a-proteobacteria)]|nr:DUF1223 domain-containing protein [Paracoccus sp. (in: a-proteobacteria)]
MIDRLGLAERVALLFMALAFLPAIPAIADPSPVIAAPDSPARTSPMSLSESLSAPGQPKAESRQAETRDRSGEAGAGADQWLPMPSSNSFSGSDLPGTPLAAIPGYTDVPVVVELFTSQGCSSCPPAEAMLTMLARDESILPLAYHVDYWDYLGWADIFARPEFTARQEAYARAAGERSIYTPQLIVAGQDTVVSPGPAQVMGLIDAARYRPAQISVRQTGAAGDGTVELVPLSDLGGRVDIKMVRYLPERVVKVTAGENRGRSVRHTNIVTEVVTLAVWDGAAPLRLSVRPGEIELPDLPPDTRQAIVVQKIKQPGGFLGPILAAIRLD